MRPGIIAVKDLVSRYAWLPRKIDRFLEAARLEPEGASRQRFDPPAALMVLCGPDPSELEPYLGWLAGAAFVLVAREVQAGEAEADSEARWREVQEDAPEPWAFRTWDPADPQDSEALLVRLLEGASAVTDAADEPQEGADVGVEVQDLPTGAWIRLPELPLGSWSLHLSRRVTLEQGELRLWNGHDRARVSLSAGTSLVGLDVDPDLVACSAEGEVLESMVYPWWRAGPEAPSFKAQGYLPVGFDPVHPIAWVGVRMFGYLLHRGPGGLGAFSAIDHDYPCGPAKKQYGYLDNEPQRAVSSPDAEVFLLQFERDALLSSAVPVRWRTAGRFDVADFPRDPHRAVFHVQADEISREFDPVDEDGHGGAPAIVLGPDERRRYAIDLARWPVYRLRSTSVQGEGGAEAVHIGGPNEGFAIFDSEHRLVGRRPGRLLGGWWRYATLAHHGRYFREDLATGARELLAPVEVPEATIVPIPGAKNVFVLDESDEHRPRVMVL